MLAVSVRDARNALSAVHGFIKLQNGIPGTLAVFHHHQCVQSDPIEVAGRNADLTLQSRVQDYNQEFLYHLLYRERNVFEYFCKMLSIVPIEKYPFFHRTRTRLQVRSAPFFKEHERETAYVLKMLEDAPVASRDMKGWKKVEWWWGSSSLSRVILERLWVCGKVMIHHREGAVKYYALTEDLIPEKYVSEHHEDEECTKEMVRIIARAARLVSASGAPLTAVGKAKKMRETLEVLEKEDDLFSLTLENYKDTLYAPVEDKKMWEDPPPTDSDYVRFLAPLDPVTWNRALFAAVYGLEYCWEIYKKAQDRKYGYYCLPVLFNGKAVGLMEPYYRKREKVLEIRNFHVLDESIEKEQFKRAVQEELERFSQYVRAENLEIKNGHQWIDTKSMGF